jgi:hypothetical protein
VGAERSLGDAESDIGGGEATQARGSACCINCYA